MVTKEVTVGERIKSYLLAEGLKQNKIAEKTGIGAAKLSFSLNGKRNLTLDEYARICSVLGVPADKFLGDNTETEGNGS